MSQLRPIPEDGPAHQACEHALRRAVLLGELKAGDRLPPERELATKLGVSRLTLRAALATLTADRVLAVRQGSGYIVQDIGLVGGPDMLPQMAAMAEASGDMAGFAAELLRVRRHLARSVLEHIVEHPPRAAEVRAFGAAVDAFEAAVAATPTDLDALGDADIAVVDALLGTTRSLVLRVCLNPIAAIVQASVALRAAMYRAPRTNVDGWRALGAWLASPTAGSIDKVVAILAERDKSAVDYLKRRARKEKS
jgi:GntR family transcriptional repressor for pyruvate dehydrogenase complex